jgi:NADPH:quinone reductase-like Zn-dependent oxidoreductase
VKAVRVHAFGGPEVLSYEEVADPRPLPGEVLVRVRAASVNHFDIWLRRGERRRPPLPFVPGSDVAGEVVRGYGRWAAGHRVIAYPATSCGACAACRRGDESVCMGYRAIAGGYAELIALPAANLHALPAALSFEEGAALPIAYLTAWRMAVTKAAVAPGDAVVVMGAAGGVGTACVQLAAAHGARVLAGVSTDAKRAHVLSVGADEAFDYTREPVTAALERWHGAPEAAVILDHVGQSVWESCVAALARGGRLVTCGWTSGAEARLSLADLTARELTVAGVVMGSRREFAQLLRMVATGRIKPAVGEVLPLSEAAAAHARLERRQALGKIVLIP